MAITYHPKRPRKELIASETVFTGPDGGLGGGGGVGIGSGLGVTGGCGIGGLGRGVGGNGGNGVGTGVGSSGVSGVLGVLGVGPMTRRHMLNTRFSWYIESRRMARCSMSIARLTPSSISIRTVSF